MSVKCPYCTTKNTDVNIIDSGFLDIDKPDKKGNTRNIYLCHDCNEVFEAFQKNENKNIPVDLFFNRAFQYCRGNLEKTNFYPYTLEEKEIY